MKRVPFMYVRALRPLNPPEGFIGFRVPFKP